MVRVLYYNPPWLFMFFNITYLDCSWISILISTIQFEEKNGCARPLTECRNPRCSPD
jgi:hypothetical protein